MIQSQEAADAGALVSAALAAMSWLADLSPLMTLAATGTAIWAGTMAGLYHFEGWRERRRSRK